MTATQYGCRWGRSTTDHLVRLDSIIKIAFAKSEHSVSMFFDF